MFDRKHTYVATFVNCLFDNMQENVSHDTGLKTNGCLRYEVRSMKQIFHNENSTEVL